jgi:hypothetical protein
MLQKPHKVGRRVFRGHDDNSNLLYLTDSEASLQAIHKWIACGAKLNLAKTPDTDAFTV